MTTSAEQAVVDALPYFDKGYDEAGVREAALTLVEEEMRRYRPTKNYLEHLPPVNTRMFETTIMHSEFERLANRLPMEMMSMRRYELPPPPAGKLTDVRAWQQAVENSQAQLEHQAMRIANLETMTSYGINAWKVYNDCLQRMLLQAERQLQELRKKIQEINWQRKNEQVDAGEKLMELEENWVGLVGKNYEIERAIVDLETEVEEKKR